MQLDLPRWGSLGVRRDRVESVGQSRKTQGHCVFSAGRGRLGPPQMSLSGDVDPKVKGGKVPFKSNLNVMQRWAWFYSTSHIKGVGGFSSDVKKEGGKPTQREKECCLKTSYHLRLSDIISVLFTSIPKTEKYGAIGMRRGKRGQHRSSCRIPQQVKLRLRAELIPPTRYLSPCYNRVWLDSLPQMPLVSYVSLSHSPPEYRHKFQRGALWPSDPENRDVVSPVCQQI